MATKQESGGAQQGSRWGSKISGFEDGRTRQPNYQWALLRLFAAKKGELSWENSEAADKLKKRKQALSETLKAYFNIDDDPFHPYRDEKTYRTKFKLKAEGD
jgi:hypothetical protein